MDWRSQGQDGGEQVGQDPIQIQTEKLVVANYPDIVVMYKHQKTAVVMQKSRLITTS